MKSGVSKKGAVPIILIVVLALVLAVGGVGIGLAWRTNYLDKWLPANIKEMFGRGGKPEEESEEPESESERSFGLFSELSFIYKDTCSIWTANEDGTNSGEVYKRPSRILAFSISPNGGLVAFTSEGKLWIMNSDLTGCRELNLGDLRPGGAPPSWSSDSRELLLAMSKKEAGSHREIYKINVGSEAITNLSKTDTYEESSPSWSPDGSRIAFASFRGEDWEVYLMNPDGSGQEKLMQGFVQGFDSAWSPDGSKLAVNAAPAGGPAVEIIDVNSGTVIRTVRASDEVVWAQPCEIFWGSNGKIYLSGGFHTQPEIIVIDSSSGSLGKVEGIEGWNPIYLDVP